MKSSILTRVIVGFALTAAVASVNCGGDDSTTPPGGGGGSGGAAGSGGTAGRGGTAGTGGSAGADASTGGGGSAGTGGTAGAGGTAGTGGTAGAGGARDAAPDVREAGPGDARPDVSDAPLPTFSAVRVIFEDHCVGCHNGTGPALNRIDLSGTSDAGTGTLYARLTNGLPAAPAGFEGLCGGFGVVEGGAEAGAEAGADGGEGGVSDAAVATRIPIVANNTAASYLYSKVTGTQVPGNPPAGCGARMPRVGGSPDGGVDGAAIASVGCDVADGGAAANCLTQGQLDTIRDWILSGAPNN